MARFSWCDTVLDALGQEDLMLRHSVYHSRTSPLERILGDQGRKLRHHQRLLCCYTIKIRLIILRYLYYIHMTIRAAQFNAFFLQVSLEPGEKPITCGESSNQENRLEYEWEYNVVIQWTAHYWYWFIRRLTLFVNCTNDGLYGWFKKSWNIRAVGWSTKQLLYKNRADVPGHL